MAYSIEQLTPGVSESFHVAITEELHHRFGILSGDLSPIHQLDEFSIHYGFQGKIGYGFFLGTLLSRMYGMHLPGGTSICMQQDLKYKLPYYVGDTLQVNSTVKSVSEAAKMVQITTVITRQNGDVVLEATGWVKISFEANHCVPLFEHDGQEVYAFHFEQALRELGVQTGDDLYIHSDITSFGKLKCLDRKTLFGALVNAMRDVTGSTGSLIVPTFTYDFCQSGIFDLIKSKSEVGVFSEFIRTLPNAVRTDHPIFSHAILSEQPEQYCEINADSFGDDSLFAKLVKRKAKILFLGTSFDRATLIHHAEQQIGVPYRYIKKFDGILRKHGEEYPVESTYYVRDLNVNPTLTMAPFTAHMKDLALLKEIKIGAGKLLLINADDFVNRAIEQIQLNPYYFVK